MTVVNPTSSPESSRNGPLVGVILILALLLGASAGGWFAWRQWFAGPTESAEFDVGAISDRYRVFANAPAPRPRADLMKDGINPAGVGFFRVKSGDFYATLAQAETSFAPMLIFSSRGDVMTPQARQLLQLSRESVNAGFAKSLNLTPDQVKKLASIRQAATSGMKIDDADRNKLRDLWKNWTSAKNDAAKAAAQTAMLAALQDAGTRSLEASRKQYADLADQVRKIVSDQQLATFRQLRGQ